MAYESTYQMARWYGRRSQYRQKYSKATAYELWITTKPRE